MSRKIFLWSLATVLLTAASSSAAQQTKAIRHIAVLSSSYTSSRSVNVQAFRQALHELGYLEGKDIEIEHRNAEGKPE